MYDYWFSFAELCCHGNFISTKKYALCKLGNKKLHVDNKVFCPKGDLIMIQFFQYCHLFFGWVYGQDNFFLGEGNLNSVISLPNGQEDFWRSC